MTLLFKKMKTNYQVAIIGGGVGGLTLAIQLADAGYSCILFEKNTYPFHKVCGEYVSMESWNFLERVGLNLSEWDLPRISRLQVSSPSGNLLTHQLGLGGFGISRFKLDHELSLLAKRKGVYVLEACKVTDCKWENEQFTIESNKGIFITQLCVGAWGKHSNMDTRLLRSFTNRLRSDKEKSYVGVKYHARLPFPDDLIGLHNFENGYCGISKVENGTCCLCYLTASENLKKYEGDIKKMEAAVVMNNPILNRYFKTAEFLLEEPVVISQVRIGYKNAVENNVLMLGDAAGNIAPLSGNGMSMAMRSSYMLYQFMDAYFKKKITRQQLGSRYGYFWKSQFKRRVQFSSMLQQLLKNSSLTNITVGVLKRISFLKNTVVKSTHGDPF